MASKKTKLPHPLRNLKSYAYRPKLPSEPKKLGGKSKPNKYTTPTVKKPSRRKMRKMQTPKEI